MSQTDAIDLKTPALDIARQIAGDDAVEQVEVIPGVTAFDEPAYHFTFLIDPERLRMRIGLVLVRVSQKLEDALTAHGGSRRAEVRLLDRTGWPKRRRARFA